jgi:hypothetical protein
VLQRQVRGRVQFTNSDRLFFLQLYRWFPSIVKAMTTIRPETLVRSPLLALEIPEPGGPATNRCGSTGADPSNEQGCRRWPHLRGNA